MTQKSCGSYSYRSGCGEKSAQKMVAARKKDTRLNMRIQPAAGIAYIPNAENDFSRSNGLYQYNAGNWNTAFISGVGFEFAKGAQRKLTLGMQYTKAIGMDAKTLTAETDGKISSTQFRSATSGWSMTLGVPISLGKKPAPVKAQPVKEYKSLNEYKGKCEQYRSRCTRKVVI